MNITTDTFSAPGAGDLDAEVYDRRSEENGRRYGDKLTKAEQLARLEAMAKAVHQYCPHCGGAL